MGALARATGNTAMNELSSRSHAIFTITVEQSIRAQQQPASRQHQQDQPQEHLQQDAMLNRSENPCSTSSPSCAAYLSSADGPPCSELGGSSGGAALSPRSRGEGGGSEGNVMEYRCAKFHLVDLAGSERTKRSGVVGTRFKEAVTINQVHCRHAKLGLANALIPKSATLEV